MYVQSATHPRVAQRRRFRRSTEVKEGKIDEYLKYHDEIWPDVAAGLRAAGVTCVIAASRAAASAQRFLRFPGS